MTHPEPSLVAPPGDSPGDPPGDPVARFQALADRADPIAVDELFAFYDQLAPVDTAFMLGEWTGDVLRTGHPGEAQLGALGWVGKSFHHEDDVDPIVTRSREGERRADPVMGKASLRVVLYRGTSTATMVYDKHPIFDHFRRVHDDLVLGVMERKGQERPLFFYLQRLVSRSSSPA
ncbi:DUF4334 domain-containing protein [Paraliomyxa miuraensis]|uniref:DUF4334 domain-containing protein n=1 Tax=Paraliomyxa miuraensis TaxID=376150 RepID=UPI00225640BB|nr:DUF4334 domain-containing protein [Paraliomyxa miuraensis]MCX4245181.1 DUF4334 domain-containing protein [Paraliomyxa miuraensis]